MAYTKTAWVDGSAPAITAAQLNRIETGVDDAHAGDLDAGAIGTTELADGSVTNVKIASGVDASKLTTGTLPADRIGTNAITTARINGLAVTTVKIAANAVTAAKTSFLSSMSANAGMFAGRVTSAGASAGIPSGWTCSRLGVGLYQVVHNLGTTAYAVAPAVDGSAGAPYVAMPIPSSNSFNVRVADTAGTSTDVSISFILVRY